MLWRYLYMNMTQSVISLKVVDVLVGNTSQYQTKGVGEDVPPPRVLHQEVPAVLLSHLISPSSYPAPLQPPPPEARGRRGGRGACDWPLHYTACREPVKQRRERWLQAETPIVLICICS